MANSFVPTHIRTVDGNLILEATVGNVTLQAGISVLLTADPTVPLGAATKQYVDAVATGLVVKDSVRVTTNTTLAATRSGSVITADANGAITIDGILLSATDRVLVKNGLVAGDTEVKEETDITCVAKASYTDNTGSTADYFDISTHLNTNRYRVYFDFSGANGNQPPADGRVLTRVDINAATDATSVGVILDGVLSGLANLSATNAVGVVTATNDTVGDAEDADGATAVSAAGMTITTTQQGVSDNSSNGIYTVTTVGDAGTDYVLTRASDADEDAEVRAGMFTFTEEGAVNKDIGFVLITDDPITVNFTAQTFAQFSTHGGDVVGPVGGSTDHALARWDAASGKLLQDSIAILTDAGVLTGLTVIGSIVGSSPLTINAGTGNLNLISADEINLDAIGVLELNATGIIGIGNDANAFGINIGTAGARPIIIGNGTTTTAVTLNSGTGSLLLGTNATDHTSTLGSVTGVSATLIQSGTGNITLTPAGTATINTTKVLDIQGGVTVATGDISGATPVAISDSGTLYTIQQTSAYAITLPNPALPGTYFMFMLDTIGAFAVTISNTDAELFGTITNSTGTVTSNGTTLTIANGAVKGDSIIVRAINATTYWVVSITSTAAGIAIS